MNEPPLTPQTGEIAKDVPKSGEIPQLSAEMDRKIEKWWDTVIEVEPSDIKSKTVCIVTDADVSRLLATALEEQKQEYLRRVEALRIPYDIIFNEAIDDVLAILNRKE